MPDESIQVNEVQGTSTQALGLPMYIVMVVISRKHVQELK